MFQYSWHFSSFTLKWRCLTWAFYIWFIWHSGILHCHLANFCVSVANKSFFMQRCMKPGTRSTRNGPLFSYCTWVTHARYSKGYSDIPLIPVVLLHKWLIRLVWGSTCDVVHIPQPICVRIKCPGCSESDETLNRCHYVYPFFGDDFRQLSYFKCKQPTDCNRHSARYV